MIFIKNNGEVFIHIPSKLKFTWYFAYVESENLQ
jgi:hypothetical protein